MFLEEHKEVDRVYESNRFSLFIKLITYQLYNFKNIRQLLYCLSHDYYVIYINIRIWDKC